VLARVYKSKPSITSRYKTFEDIIWKCFKSTNSRVSSRSFPLTRSRSAQSSLLLNTRFKRYNKWRNIYIWILPKDLNNKNQNWQNPWALEVVKYIYIWSSFSTTHLTIDEGETSSKFSILHSSRNSRIGDGWLPTDMYAIKARFFTRPTAPPCRTTT